MGQAMQAYPVGGSVGGCGARAVSRKTPIYFMIVITSKAKKFLLLVLSETKIHFLE